MGIKMSKAKWIWYGGDFEIYHHMLLSCRRQEYGCDYPCMWHLSVPEVSVRFQRDMIAETDTVIHVHTHSKGMVRAGGKKHPVNCDIELKKGAHTIEIELYDLNTFPSMYINSEYLITDESWYADAHDKRYLPVGCEPEFYSASDNPAVFPFSYAQLTPVSCEKINGGTLYDYGRELFGPVTLGEIASGDTVTVCYGESRREALDYENALVREKLCDKDEKKRPARAFRYIFVSSEQRREISISAEYEYLPIEDTASFECDEPLISDIWRVCSHTFHLNSREFYLDGIKRDRWVWSGDAYQSFMVNRYLYFEPRIIRRTITALLGKPPYRIHINTINDYSAYLIISVWDYYFSTGDRGFVGQIWENLKELYAFIVSRLDENGYVVARHGDWIFIDWGEVDKSGALCAEQILLWEVYRSMSRLSALFGEDDEYSHLADTLRENILRDFWSEDDGAFVDCFRSAEKHISRQSNVFAVLYDFADADTCGKIRKNVFYNDKIAPITTPYFKLYELMALCKLGDIRTAQDYICSYWGGMLDLGATSVWEQYNPEDSGDEHLAMYEMKYGKSLCHAWGSGPILLLGRYCCGVYPTAVAYKTFRVEPNPGKYSRFSAKVPLPGGAVSIICDENRVEVFSTAPGGTLVFDGKEFFLPVNKAVQISKKNH